MDRLKKQYWRKRNKVEKGTGLISNEKLKTPTEEDKVS